jgi:Tol biopolymer transport system component
VLINSSTEEKSIYYGFSIFRDGQEQNTVFIGGGAFVCGGSSSVSPRLSPDGNFVVFHDTGSTGEGEHVGELYVISTRGHAVQHAISYEPSFQPTAVWSPNSRLIAYAQESATYKPEGVFVVDLRSGRRRVISRTASDVAWSPDGRELALVDHDLYLVDLQGHRLRRLANAPSGGVSIQHVSWAPANTIAYTQENGNPYQAKCD